MNNRQFLTRLKLSSSVAILLLLSVRCEPITPVEQNSSVRRLCFVRSFLKQRYLDPQNRTVASNGAGLLWGCADTMSAGSMAPKADMNEASSDRSASAMEFSDDAATGFNDQGAVAGAPDPTSRDFTSTNTQEKDVDEPDIVKNDGDYIYIIRDGKLLILDAWPANDTALLSTFPLPGRPQAMFLTSDQLMVVSTDWVEVANDEEAPPEDAWGDWWGTTTVATTEVLYINISDPKSAGFYPR